MIKKIFEIEFKGLEKNIQELGKLEKRLAEVKNENKKLDKTTQEGAEKLAKNRVETKLLNEEKRKLEAKTKAQVQLGKKEVRTLEDVSRQLTIERQNIRKLEVGSKDFNKVGQRIKALELKQRDYNSAIGRSRTFVGEYAKGAAAGFAKIGVAVGGAIMAFSAIKNAIGGSLEAYDKQVKAEKSLEVALGRTSPALLDQASALQKVTEYGDEEIIQGQAFLAQMGLEEDQIKKVTPAILDMAQAKGMDLKTAFDLASKTIGSSTNALSRYGIEVKGAAGSDERLNSAVNSLNKAFEGQAKAAAETGTGAIKQMSNAWGDLKEKMGGFLSKALLPAVKWFGNLFSKIGEGKSAFDKQIDSLRKEKQELNAMVGAATDNSTSLETRARIIKKINQEYPDFLKGLNAEKVTNGQLRDRLTEVNKSLDKKLKLMVQEEVVARYTKRLADYQDREVNALVDRKNAMLTVIKVRRALKDIEEEKDQKKKYDLIDYYSKLALGVKRYNKALSEASKYIPATAGPEEVINYKYISLRNELELYEKEQTKAFQENTKIAKEAQKNEKVAAERVKEHTQTLMKLNGIEDENTEKITKNTEAIKGNTEATQERMKAMDKLKPIEASKVGKATADSFFKGFNERSEQSTAGAAGNESFIENLKVMLNNPDNQKALKEAAVNSFAEIGDAVLEGQKARIDAEMDYRRNAINEQYNDELSRYQELKNNGIYTEEQFNAKKEQLDKQKRAKEEALKKRAFKQQKKMDAEQVVMNAGVAYLKQWATTPPPIGTPFLIALAAETATQLGIIAARKYPKFAGGGVVPSGQESLQGYDNTLIAAHPGEVVLTEQQQMALGGADTFKRIGVPGFADGGVVPPSSPILTAEDIAGLMNSVRVVNVATETTDLSTKVKNLQYRYEL